MSTGSLSVAFFAVASAALLASCRGAKERSSPNLLKDARPLEEPMCPSTGPTPGTPDATIPPVPTWCSARGYSETGLIALSMDPDGRCVDLIAAAGNDIRPEPVMVFMNKGRTTVSEPFIAAFRVPDWLSGDTGFHMGLSAGRIDDDQIVDLVAVDVLSSPSVTTLDRVHHYPGDFKVYRGINCRDPATAQHFACRNARMRDGSAWHSFAEEPLLRVGAAGELLALGTALGDADGDARLDIALPLLGNERGPFFLEHFEDKNKPKPARARLYRNRGGPSPIDGNAYTEIGEPTNATSAVFADFNQDGLLDLAIAGDVVTVHFGKHGPSGTVGLNPQSEFTGLRPGTMNEDGAGWTLATTIDAGWLPKADGSLAMAVVAGFGCPQLKANPRPCVGGIAVYFPEPTGRKAESVWASRYRGAISHLRLADIDQDDKRLNDILFDTWDEPDKRGGQLHAFAARDDGTFDEDYYRSTPRFVGQAIAVADFARTAIVETSTEFRYERPGAYVFTIPETNVQRIASVRRNDTPLGYTEYTTAAGAPWISLRAPLKSGETLHVAYETSRSLDVAVATWDDQGVFFFTHYENKEDQGSTCVRAEPSPTNEQR